MYKATGMVYSLEMDKPHQLENNFLRITCKILGIHNNKQIIALDSYRLISR